MLTVKANRTNNCAIVKDLCSQEGRPGELTPEQRRKVIDAAVLLGVPEGTSKTVMSRWNKYGHLSIRDLRKMQKAGKTPAEILNAIKTSKAK